MNPVSVFLWSIVFTLIFYFIIIYYVYYGKHIILLYLINRKIYKVSYHIHKKLKRESVHISISFRDIIQHIESDDKIEFDKIQKIVKIKNESGEFHLLAFAILNITNDQLLLFKNNKEFKKYSNFYINQIMCKVIEERRIY